MCDLQLMMTLQSTPGPAPGAPPKARKAFRNYLLRSLLAPVSSARWRRYIRALYRDVAAAPAPVRVLAKPVRRYVHRAYSPRQRLALLFEHYRWLTALFSRDFLARLCAEAPLSVVRLSGRRGGEYELFVIAANAVYMQREGELAIVVAGQATGRELCRLSLCFARVDGEPAIVVGGLQGPASVFKRDVVDGDPRSLRPSPEGRGAARRPRVGTGARLQRPARDLGRQSCAAPTAGQGEILALRRILVGTRGKRGGPFGFVFGPLEASASAGDRREATKAAIVAGMEAFVAAHRAPLRPPDNPVQAGGAAGS